MSEDPVTPSPRHVAIIMDGNRRWAKARHVPAAEGHRRGAKAAESIAQACKDAGVRYLTLYAFSTENAKRPAEEVEEIMGLLRYYIKRAPERMADYNGALSFIGDRSQLPEDIQTLMKQAEDASPRSPAIDVNIALCYGARDEIIRTATLLCNSARDGRINPNEITEALFSQYLDTGERGGDPDILIRTGGEKRLSNFLLWQCAYSELYFTDCLWPDFGKDELNTALADYKARVRRFGE